MAREELSAAELSAAAGISESYLSRILSGEVTNPTIDFALRLARALGVTVSELLGEEPVSSGESERLLSRLDQLLEELQRLIGRLQ
jgi:transcriptional regulator with XRE-family HTH domain